MSSQSWGFIEAKECVSPLEATYAIAKPAELAFDGTRKLTNYFQNILLRDLVKTWNYVIKGSKMIIATTKIAIKNLLRSLVVVVIEPKRK